jgi:hypothetical protein
LVFRITAAATKPREMAGGSTRWPFQNTCRDLWETWLISRSRVEGHRRFFGITTGTVDFGATQVWPAYEKLQKLPQNEEW